MAIGQVSNVGRFVDRVHVLPYFPHDILCQFGSHDMMVIVCSRVEARSVLILVSWCALFTVVLYLLFVASLNESGIIPSPTSWLLCYLVNQVLNTLTLAVPY
jgi:hypothetical protein